MSSDEERQKALAWIESKWLGAKNCPVCHHNQWTIGDVTEIRPFTGGSLVIGGGVVPVFPVVCTNCGNTLLFNAVVAGVVQSDASEEAESEGT